MAELTRPKLFESIKTVYLLILLYFIVLCCTVLYFTLLYFTYLLHGLTCVVSRVQGLHYSTVMSTSTLGVECPMPCSPLTFKSFLMHSGMSSWNDPYGKSQLRLPCLLLLPMWLDPYFEDDGIKKNVNILVHFLWYKDLFDFLFHLMVFCLLALWSRSILLSSYHC